MERIYSMYDLYVCVAKHYLNLYTVTVLERRDICESSSFSSFIRESLSTLFRYNTRRKPMSNQEVAITIIVGAISVAISFYIKDFLMQKAQYRKLRKKLEKVAGRNANVLYGENEMFKIKDFDEDGVTLENDLKTIFIPIGMLLQNETILPSTNYSKIMKEKKEEESQEKIMEMRAVYESSLPSMMSSLKEYKKNNGDDDDDMQEVMQALMEQMVGIAEKESERDRTGELISTLMQSGSLGQPDPTKLFALKLAELLSGEGTLLDT